MGSVLTELVFLFSIRLNCLSTRQAAVIGCPGTDRACQWQQPLCCPTPFSGQTAFHFVPPTTVDLGIILGLVGAFFICAELVKNFLLSFNETDTCTDKTGS